MKTFSESTIKKIHLIFIVFLLFGTSILSFHLGDYTGFKEGAISREKTNYHKKELQIVNNDVNIDVNIDKVLSGLSESFLKNGNKTPSLNFRNSIDDIYKSAITSAANAYGLSRLQKNAALSYWEKVKENEISHLYTELKNFRNEKIAVNPNQTTTYLNNFDVAEDLASVLADRIHFVGSIALAYTPGAATDKLIFKNLSKFFLIHFVRPISQKMKEKGLVKDINITENVFNDYVKTAITELATAQDTFTLNSNKIYSRSFFDDYWFNFTSEAELKIQTYAIIKAGFPLHDYFNININHTDKTILITLSQARILSKEFADRIIDQKNGLFVKVTPEKHNNFVDELHESAVQMALEKDILDRAKEKATKIVTCIFGSWVNFPGENYKIIVNFKNEINSRLLDYSKNIEK